MIVRTWSGRVPLAHADGFRAHLLATRVADYRLQPGCREVRLWCADAEDRTVRFPLVSVCSDMDAIRAYADDEPADAALYPDDERFELVPDRVAVHHALVLADPPVSE